ncbi:MAG: DUF2786 domain-containing protein [bacterium]|nr:DUF2786 domain-containing protein [bacterium]
MQQILSKVKDLLALAADNSNIHESASAYKAAQKLLTKHKLTTANLMQDASENVIITGDKFLYSGTRMITWRGILASGVCKANGAACYWQRCRINGQPVQRLVIIGSQCDIDVVTCLYSAIVNQIEMLCSIALRGTGGGKTFSNNFKLGATNTVNGRLLEAQQEVESEYQGTAALILVNQNKEALTKAMANLNLRNKTTSLRFNSQGYAAGVAAGRNINLTNRLLT